jgi:hypothetical protein
MMLEFHCGDAFIIDQVKDFAEGDVRADPISAIGNGFILDS